MKTSSGLNSALVSAISCFLIRSMLVFNAVSSGLVAARASSALLTVNFTQTAHALAGFFKLRQVFPQTYSPETGFVFAADRQRRHHRGPDVVNRPGEIV